MKLHIQRRSAGTSLELDCKLTTMGGTSGGVTFEARAGADRLTLSFTHVELYKVIMHYRDHCDIDEVARALDEEEAKLFPAPN